MARYLIASHIHMCLAESYLVLLDLRRDKYFAFAKADLGAIGNLLPSLGLSTSKSIPPPGESDGGLSTKLLRDGVITSDPRNGREAHLTTVPTVDETCVHVERSLDQSPPSISVRDILLFAWSVATASVLLRCCSLERIVNRARGRGRRLAQGGTQVDQRALDLVRKLHFMRPFFFARKDHCLLDALVHLEYLSRNGICASWVFGVTVEPFGAHCWTQIGSTVLNDSVETVRSFTPIMSV